MEQTIKIGAATFKQLEREHALKLLSHLLDSPTYRLPHGVPYKYAAWKLARVGMVNVAHDDRKNIHLIRFGVKIPPELKRITTHKRYWGKNAPGQGHVNKSFNAEYGIE